MLSWVWSMNSCRICHSFLCVSSDNRDQLSKNQCVRLNETSCLHQHNENSPPPLLPVAIYCTKHFEPQPVEVTCFWIFQSCGYEGVTRPSETVIMPNLWSRDGFGSSQHASCGRFGDGRGGCALSTAAETSAAKEDTGLWLRGFDDAERLFALPSWQLTGNMRDERVEAFSSLRHNHYLKWLVVNQNLSSCCSLPTKKQEKGSHWSDSVNFNKWSDVCFTDL